MEDINTLWQQRLEALRTKIDQRIFNTWFVHLSVDTYDEKNKAIVLRVPSVYVYEYLEMYQQKALQWLLSGIIKDGWKLRYRILQNADGHAADYTLNPRTHRQHFKLTDAAARLRTELAKNVNRELQWLPAYDDIAWWLSDNRGRGLLCMGTSGLGKTVICRHVLPALLQQPGIVQCHATDMARRIDELLNARCVIIDNLGKEDTKYFGQADHSFFKICEAAEQQGTLLIVTTNLTTTPVQSEYRHLYPCSIEERYGREVLSRLHSIVLPVFFQGKSMWK